MISFPTTLISIGATLFCLAASALAAPALLEGARRVLFLGDSITYAGEYVEVVDACFIARFPEHRVEILNLGLPSETVSGLSEDGHAGGKFPRPDLHERLDRVLTRVQPDVVVACYGMNDGIYLPYDPARFAAFSNGIVRLRERVARSGARILHLTPPVFDETRGRGPGYALTLDRYSDWLLGQGKYGWDVADVHGPMKAELANQRRVNPRYYLAGDGVHAGSEGHWIMARELLRHLGIRDLAGVTNSAQLLAVSSNGRAILKLVQEKQRLLKDAWLTDTGHQRPGMNKGLPLAEAQARAAELDARARILARGQTNVFPGRRSSWHGFDRFDFTVDGRPVLVVVPREAAPGRPWVWHGEFFGHKPAPDIALLQRGFHIAYLSVPDMLGAPPAVAHWDACYRELVQRHGLAPKVALVGLSRGGLYCYNWAAANPDRVACIYGDAPVCDFKSWPGAFGKGKRSDRDWQLVLRHYGFASDAEARAYGKNPVDNLAPLAAARVPLLHVFGDADEVVPWEENTGLVASRYEKLGGRITLIRKPGVRHHPHGLDDPSPIVDFIWEHATSAEARTWWAARSSSTGGVR